MSKFTIHSQHTETTGRTILGQTAVHDVLEFWTGTGWTKDRSEALEFDTVEERNNYFEEHRATLKAH